MNRSPFYIIFFLLSNFSMIGLKAESNISNNEENISLEKSCEKSEGLACAKLAYKYQKMGENSLAFKFYKKGCDLNDESACFNMKNINPRDIYYNKIEATFRIKSNDIVNCHRPDLSKKISNMQLEEKWYLVDIALNINNSGHADKININTSLSEEFIKCAKNVIEEMSFPKSEVGNVSYNYKLSIISKE